MKRCLENCPERTLSSIHECSVSSLFLPLFAGMKNEAFREEKEWRLIWTQRRAGDAQLPEFCRPIRFRVSGGNLVPYVELSWPQEGGAPRMPIFQIRYGPTRLPDLARDAVQDLVEAAGFHNLKVEGSKVPLRVGV